MSAFAIELIRLAETRPTKPLAQRATKLANRATDETYVRLVRLMEFLIEWKTPADKIANAFIVNGIKPHRPSYFAEIHLRIRTARGITWKPEKYSQCLRARELQKMGAPFAEIYLAYWGMELRGISKSLAYRKNHLEKILSKQEI